MPRDKQEVENTKMDSARSVRLLLHALNTKPKKLLWKLESNKYNHGPRRRFLGNTALNNRTHCLQVSQNTRFLQDTTVQFIGQIQPYKNSRKC